MTQFGTCFSAYKFFTHLTGKHAPLSSSSHDPSYIKF